MGTNVNFSARATVGGVPFSGSATLTADISEGIKSTVAAAKTGTLSTRTDANTGTLTMAAGHGFTTGQRLDLYWTGGCRRGITIGTVSVNSVPIDLGSGDDLPIATTLITAMVPTGRECAFDGDNLKLLLAQCDNKSQFVFVDNADAELLWWYNPATTLKFWHENLYTNPLVGVNPFKVYMSHSDSAASHVMQVGLHSN